MKLIYTPTFVLLYSEDQSVTLRSVDVLDQMTRRIENHEALEPDDIETVLRFLHAFVDDDDPAQENPFAHDRERLLVAAIERALHRNQEMEFVDFAHQLIDLMSVDAGRDDSGLFEAAEQSLSDRQDENVVVQSHEFAFDASSMDELQSLESKYVYRAAS
jgi:hemerythrin-like domain-containing protein